MMIRETQDAVFNRTGRVQIPNSHIRRAKEAKHIHFGGFRLGEWSKSISQVDLSDSVLHIDIESLMFLARETINEPMPTFDPSWKGLDIDVPPTLLNGDHRVTITLTLSFPSSHSKAGLILARSNEIVIIEGPEPPEPPDGKGASLLKVRPKDNMLDLSRLDITDADGPILYVNASIPNLSWKEIASDPKFKYGLLATCVKETLRHLVINSECRTTWGAAWLSLEGIKGRDIPEVDDLTIREAWQEITTYLDNTVEAFLDQLELVPLFIKAITKSVTKDSE